MLRLCDDPLITLLRGAFPEAHVLSRPQRRLRPLTALAALPASSFRDAQVRPLGTLSPLLRRPVDLPQVLSDPSPNFSAQRTRSVKAEQGVRFLAGFLEGLGVNPDLLTGAFQGAEALCFNFTNVRHHHVDVGALGRALRGASLDPSSPATRPLLDGEEHLYLVDACFSSNAFTVEVTEGLDGGVEIHAPTHAALMELGAQVRYVSEDKRSLSFEGRGRLSYAFTALRVELGDGGRIRGFYAVDRDLSFSVESEPTHALLWPLEQALALPELPEAPDGEE